MKIRFAKDFLIPAPAGDVMLAEQFYKGQFGVSIAARANPGHDGGSFCLGKDVRHGRIPKKAPPDFAAGDFRRGWDFLSGRRGRTIEHRTDKVLRHQVRRLPRAAMLRRRNAAGRGASRCWYLQSRRDAVRGKDRRWMTMHGRSPLSTCFPMAVQVQSAGGWRRYWPSPECNKMFSFVPGYQVASGTPGQNQTSSTFTVS